MPDKRIPFSHRLDPKTGELHRIKGDGEEVIEDKVIGVYDPDKQRFTFPNAQHVRVHKQEVLTFLSDNELGIREWKRADLEADKEPNKNVPPRPKKNRLEGDKTPAVVEWYMKYFPNEFDTRYGVMGKYTGVVRILSPVWEPRPVVGAPVNGRPATDGILEYRGSEKNQYEVEDALVASRAVCDKKGNRITYLPEECVNLDNETDAEERTPVAAGGDDE